MNKQQMIIALRAFINQRSGIDLRNYDCGNWKQSHECYMIDYRPILRHGKHARTMLRAVELRDSITAEDILEASKRSFSGRLEYVSEDYLREKHGMNTDYTPRWKYTTGQYFPTEYRNAACAVLASVLWHYWQLEYKTGDEIRKRARAEFGRAIATTWFS